MRVLLTADPELTVPPKHYGGIERIIASLAAGLAARNHEVGLVSHAESLPGIAESMFPWPATRSEPLRDTLLNTMALRRAVLEFRPDVIHSFSRMIYLLPWLGAARPKVMSFQRTPSASTVRWAAHIGGNSLRFTGCSEMISRSGRRGGGDWRTIHNFVDVERFQFSPQVSPDAPLVFLSRVERIKGAHTAIAACRLAGRRLLIAGNHADDESENGRYWRNEIAPHLGKDGVEYMEEVDDRQKNELLGMAAALIVPIEWEEPFGIVFIEALACGTPVISCPRGALPEIVRDGIEGFHVETMNDAAAAIAKLPSIRREACRLRVETSFSVEVGVCAYEAIYEGVCPFSAATR